jgi:transposase
MPVPKEKGEQEYKDLEQHLRTYLKKQQEKQTRLQLFQEERQRRRLLRESIATTNNNRGLAYGAHGSVGLDR